VPHIVLGNARQPGGQWADNPFLASLDIESLSYAEQLTLPGYTFADHWRATKKTALPEFIRPTRREVAEYLAQYPVAVGSEKNVQSATKISSITRLHGGQGFHIATLDITCKHLVLATGIFNLVVQPPPFLKVLKALSPAAENGPVLIIGSGFTAADLIMSTPPHRKIIHIFNWAPSRPSPLKGCHGSAYPEYAFIYRLMKSAVDKNAGKASSEIARVLRLPPKSAIKHFADRDWTTGYEGFPNARVMETSLDVDYAQVWDRMPEKVRRQSQDLNGPPLQPNAAAPMPAGHSFFNFGRRKGSLPASTLSVPEAGPSQGRRASHVPYTSSAPPSMSATVLIGRSYIGVDSFDDTSPRKITSFHYAAGRRGSLSYLRAPLLEEVLKIDHEVSPPVLAPHIASHANHPATDLSPSSQPPSDTTHIRPQASNSNSPPKSHAGTSHPPTSTDSTSAASLFANATDPGSLASSLFASKKAADHASDTHSERSLTHDFALDPLAHPDDLLITGQTLRVKIESFDERSSGDGGRRNAFEVAKDVFVIGSLTGDSLIRFAFGGCCAVAGALGPQTDCVNGGSARADAGGVGGLREGNGSALPGYAAPQGDSGGMTHAWQS